MEKMELVLRAAYLAMLCMPPMVATNSEIDDTGSFDYLPSYQESSADTADSPWSSWGNWTDCSRDCGGGISLQRRECLYGTCGGVAVRYRTCNLQECPEGSPDFRNRQCEAYNDVQYNGQLYSWMSVASLPVEAECSLVCRARGYNLTETLSLHVLDGTPCKPDSRDMCLNGTCIPIGCNYEFNSTLSIDQCMVCGGDNSTCKMQTRRKTSAIVDAGLEKLMFLPKGSFSVKIGLKTRSTSFLGMKTEDGADGINQKKGSPSGYYTVGGVDIEFRRLRNGRSSIIIPGRLDKNFYVTILRTESLKRDETPDKVIFTYMTPIYYIWRATEWSSCTRSCSTGSQERTWRCHDKLTGEVVMESRCQKRKPEDERRPCNTHDCPPMWSITWGDCSSSCGGGLQRGTALCKQEGSEGVDYLNAELCLDPMPDNLRTCNTEPCPRWHFTNFTECSTTCGAGTKYRTVQCLNYLGEEVTGCNMPAPPRVVECVTRVVCLEEPEDRILHYITPEYAEVLEMPPSYSFSDWSPCSVSCGIGIKTREVKCRLFVAHDGTFIDQPLSKCQHSEMPQRAKRCEMDPCEMMETTTYGMTTNDDRNWEPPQPDSTETRLEGIHHILEDQPRDTGTMVTKPFKPRSGDGRDSKTGGFSSSVSYEMINFDDESPYSVESEYADETNSYSDLSAGGQRYMWQQTGFSECSLSCAGGIQESIVECVDSLTDNVVKDSRCYYSEPLGRNRQMCNEQPCPPEWRALLYSDCSHTCGSGLKYPERVICLQITDEGMNKVLTLRDSACENLPRPEPTACAKFECPPFWMMTMWSPCTETCGRGTRSRMVKCKQILGDGQEVDRPSTYCPGQPPPETQACNQIDCPPSWLTGELTECSVTCGPGHKFRPVECVQVLANGGTDILDSSRCPAETKPVEMEPCVMDVCFEPRIVANNTNYVQEDTEGKIYLTVGQRARMLTKTSLIVRCPVEGVRKPDVQWLTGSAVVPHNRTMRVRVITGGSLKFSQLTVDDSGIYTCTAGQLSEKFYLTVVPHEDTALEGESNYNIYKWTLGEWSSCTVSCGGGYRRRDVLCQHVNRRGIDEFTAPERCAAEGLLKPDDIELCNKQLCTPHWVVTDWTQCSGAVCQSVGFGIKTRQVGCMNSSGAYISEDECEAVPELIKPSNITSCKTELCVPMWHVSRWEPCSASCGRGIRMRKVKCMYRETNRKADRAHCQAVTDQPNVIESCNAGDCTEAQSGCTDELRYCSVVLKVDKCDQPYFRRACCATCAVGSDVK